MLNASQIDFLLFLVNCEVAFKNSSVPVSNISIDNILKHIPAFFFFCDWGGVWNGKITIFPNVKSFQTKYGGWGLLFFFQNTEDFSNKTMPIFC